MLMFMISFESREVCEEVIKTFNNTPITKPDGQEHLVQIRFADTQEQKSLKHQTTQARDWRSQEYELQTTGRSSAAASFNRVPASVHSAEADFEAYIPSGCGHVGDKSNSESKLIVNSPKAASDYKYPHSAFGRFARERLHAVTDQINPLSNQVAPTIINVNLPSTVTVETPEERHTAEDVTTTLNNANVDPAAYNSAAGISVM